MPKMLIEMIQVDDSSEVTDEARWHIMRLNRDNLLQLTDWRAMPDRPNADAWIEWRQQLRDFPATWVPADSVEFPDPPEALL